MLGRLFGRRQSADDEGRDHGERGGFLDSILELLGVETESGDEDGRDDRRRDERDRRQRDDEFDELDF
jgi:hypothetical protein